MFNAQRNVCCLSKIDPAFFVISNELPACRFAFLINEMSTTDKFARETAFYGQTPVVLLNDICDAARNYVADGCDQLERACSSLAPNKSAEIGKVNLHLQPGFTRFASGR